MISEVPESPSSETIAAISQADDGPIDLIGKLGSSGAEAAARLGGGDDNDGTDVIVTINNQYGKQPSCQELKDMKIHTGVLENKASFVPHPLVWGMLDFLC